MSRAAGTAPDSTPNGDDRALTLVHQGWNHLQLQRPLAAWASWQRALRVEPEHEAARQALATLESATDLPVAARASYRFQAPDDPERRARWDQQLRGRDLEQLSDAADAFAALIAEDPADSSAWYNRALCLAWLGRNAEAISCLDRVVTLVAKDRFEEAVAAWSLAEVLRQGAGAESLADDLRYAWVFEWDEGDTAGLLERCPELRELPFPRDPVSGDPRVPDARLFEWLDRPLPDAGMESLPAADLPRLMATVVISPRSLRLSSPDPETLEWVNSRLAEALGEAPGPARREATPLPLPLLDAAVWTFRPPPGLDPEAESRLSREAVEHYYENLWIHLPRQGLGGRSPLEASRDAKGRDDVAHARLAAVVRLREQLGARPKTGALYQGYPFDRLRKRLGLGLEDPATVDPDDVSCMGEDDLDRLDPALLGDDRLAEAYESAAGLQDDRRTARFAAALVQAASAGLARVASPTLFAPLVREAMRSGDAERALQWLEAARSTHAGRDRRTYDVWAAEIHARTGDPDAALATYRRLLEDADADVGTALILDAAEDLLSNGYLEHARPLLDEAVARARRERDPVALDRALALAGEESPGDETL